MAPKYFPTSSNSAITAVNAILFMEAKKIYLLSINREIYISNTKPSITE